MFIDISYQMDEELLIYPGDPKFQMNRVVEIGENAFCNVSNLTMGTHTGTHLDAPLHFVKDGKDIASMPISQFTGKVEVIDLSEEEDLRIIDDKLLEKLVTTDADILFFKTTNGARFAGKNILEEFVTIDLSGAKWLVEHNIKMIGVDYMTIEKAELGKPSAHEILLSNEIIIVESIDLREVARGEYKVYCFPLKLKAGDGSPVRVVLETL